MVNSQVEITNFITPLINTFRYASDEWKNLMEIGVSEYIYSQTEKYYLTNTFLHRSEKVRFRDIYYPLSARNNLLTTNFESPIDIFEEYRKITIIGNAGSGKSTLLRHIFFKTIEGANYIPIIVELRNLNDFKGDFKDLVFEKILNTKLKPSIGIAKRALLKGKFLFLLDGYDEIFSSKKQDIKRQIENFVDTYSHNYFLITTRPGGGIEGFPRFHNFDILSLDDDQVKEFINKIVSEPERRTRINKIIQLNINSSYAEYLRNPLLLSMFILAFESHPEIPERKSAFYRNVFDTLYSRHDGITKNSFLREKLTNLQRDDFERILNVFSYQTLSAGKFTFTDEYLSDSLMKLKKPLKLNYSSENIIYDLRTAISILVLDGFEYSFPHRSLQEYFAANFLGSLPTGKKESAYKNLTGILVKQSNDYSFNLYSLCYELDKVAFIKNFLIPYLEKFKKDLSKVSEYENIRSFIKISNLIFDFVKSDKYMVQECPGLKLNCPFLAIKFHKTLFMSILEFLNINTLYDLFYFLELSKANLELAQFYPDEFVHAYFAKDVDNDPQVIKILYKYKFVDEIEKIRSKIQKKIIDLQDEISQQELDIDELLNI